MLSRPILTARSSYTEMNLRQSLRSIHMNNRSFCVGCVLYGAFGSGNRSRVVSSKGLLVEINQDLHAKFRLQRVTFGHTSLHLR